MRPLTLAHVVRICALLSLVLVAVVLLALRLGAVPFSLGDLGQNLWWLASGHPEKLSTDFRLIMVDIRLPRILLGIFVGAALFGGGRQFPGAAAESARRSLCPRRFERRGAGRARCPSAGAGLASLDAAGGVSRRDDHHLRGLLARAAPRPARQQHAASRGDHHRIVPVGHHHVPDDHARQPRPARHRLLADGRSFHGPAARTALEFWSSAFSSATGAIYTTASDLNLLLAGEREAMHLGVDVTRVKLVVYISASVLTGLAVAVSGAIGYVGLLVPHLMRMLFGSDYRLLIPTSALGGAIAVVLADTWRARWLRPPSCPSAP